MSDIFEEVEESIRQDRATELWKKYGLIVWIIGLSIIGAVGYMEWNKIQKAEATETRIEAFEDARAKLAAGEYAEAQIAFKELVDADADISPLAAQFLAQAYYEGNGDAAAAADILRASSALEGPVERLALLKSAYLRSDAMNLAELEDFLGELPAESTALGVLALELIAAKAFKEGDIERARKEFGYLRFAPNTPQGVAQRAEIALSIIPVPEVAPEAPESEALPDDAPEANEETVDAVPASIEGESGE